MNAKGRNPRGAPVLFELYRALLGHAETGCYLRLTLSPETHRSAERILSSMESVGLRSADALHLASAVSAQARTLATFDDAMRRAAGGLGLTLLPLDSG